MTSKEALENILKSVITNVAKGSFISIEFLKQIKQDLDRLEKLEKFVDIYKYTNQRFTMLVQAPYTDLPHPTLEQELLRVEVLSNE